MNENTSAVTIRLEAEDHASPVIAGLRRSLDRLARVQSNFAKAYKPRIGPGGAADFGSADLRRQFAFESRMRRQRVREEREAGREAARMWSTVSDRLRFQNRMAQQLAGQERQAERYRRQAEAADARSFRQRLAFSTRMQRQRADEERAGEREHLARVRRLEREHVGARRGFMASGSRAFSSGREAVDRITRTPAAVAAVGGVAAGAAARRVLSVESDVDAAEVNARIYGGLSKDAARALREQWAVPLSEQLGSTTAQLLAAYTEALKVGIPDQGAKAFTGLATKTAEAWDVPFQEVVDTLGTVNSLLTADGSAFNFDKLKSVANTMQFLAAKMSTTPQKMISFMQRGAGAAQLLGMSPEAGLAFGAASTSLGNQAGQSGRLFDYTAGRLISLPKIAKGHGDDAKMARKLVSALGYNGMSDMRAKQAADPDSSLFDFIERFQNIQDPKKRNEMIRWFAGQEWLGEFGRMVVGFEKVREAQKLAQEAGGFDAIGDVWSLHITKLSFIFKQVRAGFLNVLGEAGMVLSPIAAEIGSRFLSWSQAMRAGGLRAKLQAAVDGVIQGLGFSSIGAMLDRAFGGAGAGWSAESIGKFARGFASGVREVGSAIVETLRAVSGGSTDPETLGRWSARILGFSAALRAASPVLDVLRGVGSAFVSIAAAAATLWSGLRIAQAFTGAGAAGAIGAGGIGRAIMGSLLSGLGVLFGAAALGQYRVEISAFLVAKTRDFITAFLDELRSAFHDLPRRILDEITPAPLQRILNAPPPAAGQTPEIGGWGFDFLGPRFARGGYVSGPGSTTSDSIPALLSNGEFVMNADAVRNNRPLLEALNDGRIQRFARGGFVGIGGDGFRGGPASYEQGDEIIASLHRLVDLTQRGTEQTRIAALGALQRGGASGSSPGGSSSGSSGPTGSSYSSPDFKPPSWHGTGRGRNGAGDSPAPGGPVEPFTAAPRGRGGYAAFDSKAPQIVGRLMRDFQLTREQAAGIVGNLGHESGAFRHYAEVGRPNGGVGWAQWTGHRRRAFEAFTRSRGLDPKSDEASYAFLTQGEPGEWGRALAAVRRQSTVKGSMLAFEQTYERAGVKGYGSRGMLAERAYRLADGAQAPNGAQAPAGAAPASVSPLDTSIGDSIAHGLRQAGQMAGMTRVGAGTREVLGYVRRLAPSLSGHSVVLSSGASNSPRDLTPVAEQIETLKRAGAKVTLLGVGTRIGQAVNERLKVMAAAAGVAFREIGPTGADGVHPRSYGTLLDSLNRARDLARSAVAPSAPVVANAIRPPSAPDLAQIVAPPASAASRGAAGQDAARSADIRGSAPPVTINLHGAGHSPEEMVNMLQRRIGEAWTRRSHDIEADPV